MDIRNILNEQTIGAPTLYSQLDPLHIAVLKKIAANAFDPDSASPKVKTVLDDLVGLGLVSDLDFELTLDGIKALRYAEKLGGSVERRQAAARVPARSEPLALSDVE